VAGHLLSSAVPFVCYGYNSIDVVIQDKLAFNV